MRVHPSYLRPRRRRIRYIRFISAKSSYVYIRKNENRVELNFQCPPEINLTTRNYVKSSHEVELSSRIARVTYIRCNTLLIFPRLVHLSRCSSLFLAYNTLWSRVHVKSAKDRRYYDCSFAFYVMCIRSYTKL